MNPPNRYAHPVFVAIEAVSPNVVVAAVLPAIIVPSLTACFIDSFGCLLYTRCPNDTAVLANIPISVC